MRLAGEEREQEESPPGLGLTRLGFLQEGDVLRFVWVDTSVNTRPGSALLTSPPRDGEAGSRTFLYLLSAPTLCKSQQSSVLSLSLPLPLLLPLFLSLPASECSSPPDGERAPGQREKDWCCFSETLGVAQGGLIVFVPYRSFFFFFSFGPQKWC